MRELLDDARLRGPDEAALEAPDEYVAPFHDLLCAAAIGPARAPCAKTFSPGCAFFKSNPPGSNPNAPPIG